MDFAVFITWYLTKPLQGRFLNTVNSHMNMFILIFVIRHLEIYTEHFMDVCIPMVEDPSSYIMGVPAPMHFHRSFEIG